MGIMIVSSKSSMKISKETRSRRPTRRRARYSRLDHFTSVGTTSFPKLLMARHNYKIKKGR